MTNQELEILVAKAVARANLAGRTITISKEFEDIADQLAKQSEFRDVSKQVGGRIQAGPWPIKLPGYGLKEGERIAPVTKGVLDSTGFASERSYLPFMRAPGRRLRTCCG